VSRRDERGRRVTARRGAAVAGALVIGFVAGAVLTLSLQTVARVPTPPGRLASPPAPAPTPSHREASGTFLAWTPGGLPVGFRSALPGVPLVERAVVVESDIAWLTRSFASTGEVVDDPPAGLAIPLEVAAVDPGRYAAFLPPVDRGVVADLAHGYGVLGESSARLRHLGPGAVLRFGPVGVRISAVLPDELVGANELLVSRARAAALGITHDRYALIQPRRPATDRRIRKALRPLVPAGTPVQVRAPGETPYFRQGDAVLPPVQLKLLFGEFAAAPDPARPGYLRIDPAWERAHIATEHVPILGDVTCNVELFPQLRGALRELVRRGLRDTITTYSGCYARRYTNRDPNQSISHHTWGIAVDINVPQNPFGAPPHQDPRLVRVFERWGFIWGGTFIVPDGMHFEYRRPPER
jgi:D-alanyl-D-alanine carboxypeptidase-like protein